MQRFETDIPGLLILEPDILSDDRGLFFEAYHEEKYRSLGVDARFVQDNFSRSRRDVVRGLHYQLAAPQAKLCQVVRGAVLDVVADIRRGSAAYGRWVGVLLSEENRRQLYIPPGCAHGFAVLSETTDFLYKCSRYYDPADDRGIAWNDPDLGIVWPIEAPILSPRDTRNPFLATLSPDQLPE
jgi:dTDP-4-dehydrorhamnose 3,5-epimerase